MAGREILKILGAVLAFAASMANDSNRLETWQIVLAFLSNQDDLVFGIDKMRQRLPSGFGRICTPEANAAHLLSKFLK
jgi:hypothetical protein